MKNKLLLLLIFSLTTLLSACGTDVKTADVTLPTESESSFYESNTEIKPSFELLADEMTLECGTPFDTDDLSKYIKADNYDNILINIFYTEKTKSSIDRHELTEQCWDDMGLKPQVYEIVFIDYNTKYEITMLLNYQDTTAPVLTMILENNNIEYYLLELTASFTDDYETLVFGEGDPTIRQITKSKEINDVYYDSHYSSVLDFYNLVESDDMDNKEIYLMANGQKVDLKTVPNILEELLKIFSQPGTYTIDFCQTDFGDNTSSLSFNFKITEDISPIEKESLSEEEYQTLYNNYLSQK